MLLASTGSAKTCVLPPRSRNADTTSASFSATVATTGTTTESSSPTRSVGSGGADRVTPVSRAVVLSAVRTPIGRYGGALGSARPDDLAATVIEEAVRRAGVPPDAIE